MRKAAGRVRITGQLIDATTGAHLWADRFEGDLSDIFQLQDQVTISVVGAIEPRFAWPKSSGRCASPPKTSKRMIWFFVVGGPMSAPTKRYEEAARLYRRAIAIDPNYARCVCPPCSGSVALASFQWTKPSEEELTEYVALARTAVQLGQADPETLGIAAHIIALPGGDLTEGIAIIDRALVQNPNSVECWQ